MAELAQADRDAALRAIFSGTLYMGLARETADDEETDPNYRRRPVTLSEPQGDGRRFVTNEEPVLFPEYRNAATRPVRYALLFDAPTGGARKWADTLDEPMQLPAGGILFFARGRFKIGIA